MYHIIKERQIQEGQRDIILFAMYSVLSKLYNKEDARELLERINSNFTKPLNEAEVISICCEIERKNHKFTNERFLHFVQATEEERAWFDKCKNRKN